MISLNTSERVVPAWARELAAGMVGLFERDVEIVERLNDAGRRLRDANQRLWSGLSPDAAGVIYDGVAVAGESQIAGLIEGGLGADTTRSMTAVLAAMQQAHWAIHRSFHDYQSACEERRQLAVDVGELSTQLTDALCAAGFSTEDALSADVHQLWGVEEGRA